MLRPVALALLLAGCAASKARLLEDRAAHHVFHRDEQTVAEAVTRYFIELGFEWDAPRPNGMRRTAWKEVYGEGEFGSAWQRYFVLIKPLGPRHSQLEVLKLSRSTNGMETYHPTTFSNAGGRGDSVAGASNTSAKGSNPLPMGPPSARRALEVEWALIRRLEPERAAALENRVEAAR